MSMFVIALNDFCLQLESKYSSKRMGELTCRGMKMFLKLDFFIDEKSMKFCVELASNLIVDAERCKIFVAK